MPRPTCVAVLLLSTLEARGLNHDYAILMTLHAALHNKNLSKRAIAAIDCCANATRRVSDLCSKAAQRGIEIGDQIITVLEPDV